MLIHRKGNLLDLAEQGEFDFVVHGCNCQNIMGGGIAKEIRERFPLAYEADTKATQQWQRPVAKLGNVSWYAHKNEHNKEVFVIINAYTQVETSKQGEDVFEYDSFAVILQKLVDIGEGMRFGLPYIGMGLAGGDKDRIMAMIESFAEKVTAKGGAVTLVEFQP